MSTEMDVWVLQKKVREMERRLEALEKTTLCPREESTRCGCVCSMVGNDRACTCACHDANEVSP